jgi:sugar phosphate isomerase/epimerase
MTSSIKLGYSTYAMQGVDIYEALPRLPEIGYQAVEIMASEGWMTAPDLLDQDDRNRLAGTISDLELDLSAVMAFMPLCAEREARRAMLEEFQAVCELARDLWLGTGPAVVSSPIGGPLPPWENSRERIVADLMELAGIAQEHGVNLAVEPHVNQVFDSPEKAVWLMDNTNHPALGINFDISHFHVFGMDLRHCVDLCLPHAVHIHVKDGYLDENGGVVFQLPGDGNLDLGEYLRLLKADGKPRTVSSEVSGMIWKHPDYNPWAAAESSYLALARARESLR